MEISKLISGINFGFGIFYLLIFVIIAFVINPRLASLYEDFNLAQSTAIYRYIALLIPSMLAVINIFTGYKGLKKNISKKLNYVIFAINIALFFLIPITYIYSMVIPIYSLSY